MHSHKSSVEKKRFVSLLFFTRKLPWFYDMFESVFIALFIFIFALTKHFKTKPSTFLSSE